MKKMFKRMSDSQFTLLAVDDDQEDLEIFCEAIQEINPSITCLVAYNGREAISLLSKLTVLPKIIFLDHNMPQMDGKQCLHYLKKDERYKTIPVVIYSTSFSREDIDYFLGAGAFIHQKQVKYTDIMKNLAITLHNIVKS
jgi:CheY-like chemotaxis protein